MNFSPFLVCCIVTFCYVVWKYLLRSYVSPSPLDNLPGSPSSSLLMGNLQQVTARDGWKFRRHHAETYGPVSTLRRVLGVLVVLDPKALHSILVKDMEGFPRRTSPSDHLRLLMGPGLATAEGLQHRRQRKLLTPVFSTDHLRQMTDLFYKISHNVRDAVRGRVIKEAGVVDVNGWMGRTTLEFLGRAAIGYSFDNFAEDSTDTYGNALQNCFPTLSQLGQLTWAIAWLSYIASPDNIKALLRILPVERVRRIMEISDIMRRHSIALVTETRAALAKADSAQATALEDGPRKDIMSILLKANAAAPNDEKLSDEELAAQTSVLIIAGMDTTSNTLTRVLHLLAQHPNVQEKLRAEVTNAHDSQATLDYDTLNKLPYLDAVCRETLRLYPPTAVIPRRAAQDVRLPLSTPIRGKDCTMINEVAIPRGTYVMVNIQASNENKALWGEDAYEWKSERWLQSVPAALNEARVPSIYSNTITFLGGPRSCIGFKFAELEMKVILSVMVMAFSFELTDNEITWNVGPVSFPTMGPGSTKPELLLRLNCL